ncbi:MAG: ElaA protein [Cyclobacteriaceae bacterium]|jgi:ElaA protein
MGDMKTRIKSFQELSNQELYALLALRSEVFVVEQDCSYQDLDGHDQKAIHLLGYQDQNLAACSRIFAPDDYFDGHASIGRIATSPDFRKLSYGKQIVEHSLSKIYELYGNECPIKIGAQAYLIRFYEYLGFKNTEMEFLEDGIPHIYMIQ